jgi:hypothetical protein
MSDLQNRATRTMEVIQSSDGRTTLLVPIRIKRRSGRNHMTLPNDEPDTPRPWDVGATAL